MVATIKRHPDGTPILDELEIPTQEDQALLRLQYAQSRLKKLQSELLGILQLHSVAVSERGPCFDNIPASAQHESQHALQSD